ncbi:MAG TPA: LytTR family DNA-binding domain-containing protein [Sphingomonadaceae bacterium]|nr:LytTR family DNA-binding domain-containing protein [Sphingomonadaceae bacterium]
MVADDEPPARALLRHLLIQLGAEVVGEAADGAGAWDLSRALKPDVAVLDIAMPGLNGMEAARQLALLPHPPGIIFCTAFDGYAIAAFDVAAIDYLLKPVEEDRLARALGRAAPLAGKPPPRSDQVDHLWVPHRADLVRVSASTVERVEAERDYVRVHVGGRSHLLRATMDQMERRLDARLFIRLHRSTIVRRDLIEALRHEGGGVWSAVLVDGHQARIGRSYLEAARALGH